MLNLLFVDSTKNDFSLTAGIFETGAYGALSFFDPLPHHLVHVVIEWPLCAQTNTLFDETTSPAIGTN